MKKRKVINAANRPAYWPLTGTFVWWLVLDKLDPPGWVWGSVGACIVLAWIGIAVSVFTQEQLEPFE